MQMDLFSSSVSVDSTFTRLRDDPKLAQQRAFINALYNSQFEPFADKDFRDRFPLECVSRFWEMYVGCALVQNGFKIVERENRPSKEAGPDFCIVQNGSHLWVEAVTPNI